MSGFDRKEYESGPPEDKSEKLQGIRHVNEPEPRRLNLNPVDTPYEFNKAMLRLNRIRAPQEEKEKLLRAIARSPQALTLYSHFLHYGCEAVDPRSVGLPEATRNRLMKLFVGLGLVEEAGRRRGGRGFLVTLWRLKC